LTPWRRKSFYSRPRRSRSFFGTNFTFTPKPGTLNLIEDFFSKLARSVLRYIVSACVIIGSVNEPAASADGQGEKTMATSGIEGQVSFGPTSPLARPGIPNYRPMQARITVLTAEGKVIGQFETDADGRFRMEISPGSYTLHPEPSGGHDRVADRRVTVPVGEMVKVGINYDSGMR
jgi:hypothetical protein